jgi:hypothetical protein
MPRFHHPERTYIGHGWQNAEDGSGVTIIWRTEGTPKLATPFCAIGVLCEDGVRRNIVGVETAEAWQRNPYRFPAASRDGECYRRGMFGQHRGMRGPGLAFRSEDAWADLDVLGALADEEDE